MTFEPLRMCFARNSPPEDSGPLGITYTPEVNKILRDMGEAMLKDIVFGADKEMCSFDRIDIKDEDQRRFAQAAGSGYMAGLSGNDMNPFPVDDPRWLAWQHGWEQGREHFATTLEQESAREGNITRERMISSILARMQIISSKKGLKFSLQDLLDAL